MNLISMIIKFNEMNRNICKTILVIVLGRTFEEIYKSSNNYEDYHLNDHNLNKHQGKNRIGCISISLI